MKDYYELFQEITDIRLKIAETNKRITKFEEIFQGAHCRHPELVVMRKEYLKHPESIMFVKEPDKTHFDDLGEQVYYVCVCQYCSTIIKYFETFNQAQEFLFRYNTTGIKFTE